MTLNRWAISSCPKLSLVDGTSNFWTTSSGSGTNEYFYNSGLFQHEPNYVSISGTVYEKAAALPGALSVGEWSWGDVDSLGEDTIYVRLLDETDPDTKAEDYIKCSDTFEVLSAALNKETVSLSLLISNYSSTEGANIWIFQTDGTNILFKWYLSILQGDSPFALDSRMVFNSSDQLLIMSDVEDVSIIINGDES